MTTRQVGRNSSRSPILLYQIECNFSLKRGCHVTDAKLYIISQTRCPKYIQFLPVCIIDTFRTTIDTSRISKVKKVYCLIKYNVSTNEKSIIITIFVGETHDG